MHGGIDIRCNDEHSLNVNFSMDVTEGGIVISFRDVQSSKANSPMNDTEDGIDICANEEHF